MTARVIATGGCLALIVASIGAWVLWPDAADSDGSTDAIAQRWRAVPADPEQPGAYQAQIARGIREGRLLKGATRPKVLSLLGPPYSRDSDELVYRVGAHRVSRRGSTLNCGSNLILVFRNGRLARGDTRTFCVPTE